MMVDASRFAIDEKPDACILLCCTIPDVHMSACAAVLLSFRLVTVFAAPPGATTFMEKEMSVVRLCWPYIDYYVTSNRIRLYYVISVGVERYSTYRRICVVTYDVAGSNI